MSYDDTCRRCGATFPGKPCEACGSTTRLHVHHKDRNWRNDEPANLMTLCASCHLRLHWREDREQRMASNTWVKAARANTA
ncbi:HNH endonuclease [Luteipulveratus halotolerans]|uniref:HNH endonuclease n=1 Tax=Luteipulveratus halotolerans TaxID=1631356 RepID=UPI00068164A0|nr:HNH endonuclease [Luteipulveratus halotolerans]